MNHIKIMSTPVILIYLIHRKYELKKKKKSKLSPIISGIYGNWGDEGEQQQQHTWWSGEPPLVRLWFPHLSREAPPWQKTPEAAGTRWRQTIGALAAPPRTCRSNSTGSSGPLVAPRPEPAAAVETTTLVGLFSAAAAAEAAARVCHQAEEAAALRNRRRGTYRTWPRTAIQSRGGRRRRRPPARTEEGNLRWPMPRAAGFSTALLPSSPAASYGWGRRVRWRCFI